MNINIADFLQAGDFIFADIQREINLAKSKNNAGNFLCALGLLCYTEFAGGIKRKNFGDKESKNNFNLFFRELGKKYEELLNHHDVYKIFRCGLAHEYYVKKHCIIYMLKGKEDRIGIGINSDGMYYFVVEKYFEDFKKAFGKLANEIITEIRKNSIIVKRN
jgi:hypothetical protein